MKHLLNVCYDSFRSAIIKEVPYARLIETCPPLLTTAKLDSDSKLHMEKGKLCVASTEVDMPPKNSVSDSKLAVDYFNSPKPDTYEIQVNSVSNRMNYGICQCCFN